MGEENDDLKNVIEKALNEQFKKDNEIREEEFKNFYKKINVGFVAASFTVILAMLQIQVLDYKLHIAVVCFSLILPINIYFGFLSELAESQLSRPIKLNPIPIETYSRFTIFTITIACLGLTQIIFHFSNYAPIAFTISILVLIPLFKMLMSRVDNQIEKVNAGEYFVEEKTTELIPPEGNEESEKEIEKSTKKQKAKRK